MVILGHAKAYEVTAFEALEAELGAHVVVGPALLGALGQRERSARILVELQQVYTDTCRTIVHRLHALGLRALRHFGELDPLQDVKSTIADGRLTGRDRLVLVESHSSDSSAYTRSAYSTSSANSRVAKGGLPKGKRSATTSPSRSSGVVGPLADVVTLGRLGEFGGEGAASSAMTHSGAPASSLAARGQAAEPASTFASSLRTFASRILGGFRGTVHGGGGRTHEQAHEEAASGDAHCGGSGWSKGISICVAFELHLMCPDGRMNSARAAVWKVLALLPFRLRS